MDPTPGAASVAAYNTSSSADAGNGGNTTGYAAAAASNATTYDPTTENDALSSYLLVTCASLSAALILWRLSFQLVKYVREVTCLNNDTQRYFATESSNLSFFKRNILYAPIFRKRHNREFQLSSAINVGTLPTRLQLVFIVGYFATNVAFSVIDIDFTTAGGAATFRNRTGTLAVANMIPLVLLAGRNNPLIPMLGISFDTFNLIHRWFGRIVMLEAVAHVLSYIIPNASKETAAAIFTGIFKEPYLAYGFVAVCALVAISIQAVGAVRHAFYETFKIVHILLVITAIIGLWYHLQLKHYPQIRYLYPVVVFWLVDRTIRGWRIGYRNVGAGGTRTVVEALPGNACRVTVTMARPWNFKPGQHAYLYMPSIGLMTSHPFSTAWSEDATDLAEDKLAEGRQDVLEIRKSQISFVVRARTGFTNTLYRKAVDSPEGRLVTTCFVEGPYGGHHQMHSYGTVVLFAGGVGIAHQVPYVRDLVVGYSNGTVATRRVVLVWVIQSPEHLEWIRPWMTEILAMERRREILRIMLFVSRPRSTKEIHSPSATVQMFPGRPNVETLLGIEMEQQIGAMAVSVCGPGAFSDEVRRAVRNRQYSGTVDFVEEAFSW